MTNSDNCDTLYEVFGDLCSCVLHREINISISENKEVRLFVKPEEAKAYYVINGTESGNFEI